MFPDFSPTSRVWVYQSDRRLDEREARMIEDDLNNFCKEWKAHGNKLRTAGKVVENHFLVLVVDESAEGASGCSIDSSVRFLKDLEVKYSLSLFNRLMIAVETEVGIELFTKQQLQRAIEEGTVDPDALMYNNTIQTKHDLDNHWKVPIKKSWLAPLLA